MTNPIASGLQDQRVIMSILIGCETDELGEVGWCFRGQQAEGPPPFLSVLRYLLFLCRGGQSRSQTAVSWHRIY